MFTSFKKPISKILHINPVAHGEWILVVSGGHSLTMPPFKTQISNLLLIKQTHTLKQKHIVSVSKKLVKLILRLTFTAFPAAFPLPLPATDAAFLRGVGDLGAGPAFLGGEVSFGFLGGGDPGDGGATEGNFGERFLDKSSG